MPAISTARSITPRHRPNKKNRAAARFFEIYANSCLRRAAATGKREYKPVFLLLEIHRKFTQFLAIIDCSGRESMLLWVK